MTKYLLSILVLVFVSTSTVLATGDKEHRIPKVCETGTYKIGTSENGDDICKENPKSCPYAENITVDDTKCIAPKPPVVEVPTPVAPVVEQQTLSAFIGK